MIELLPGSPGTAQFRASRTRPYPRPTPTQYLLGTPPGLPVEQLLHRTPPGCATPAKVFHGGKRSMHVSVLPTEVAKSKLRFILCLCLRSRDFTCAQRLSRILRCCYGSNRNAHGLPRTVVRDKRGTVTRCMVQHMWSTHFTFGVN